MKVSILKYLTVVFILLGILERSSIPVVSFLGKHLYESEKIADTDVSEDPLKESETLKEASAKEYIHQLITYYFAMPVSDVPGHDPGLLKTKFPYCYYPDVPTPPPNA